MYILTDVSVCDETKLMDYSLFVESVIPQGICADSKGNVFVTSVNPDNAFQNLITKYSPKGDIIKQNITDLFGYIEYNPTLDKIFLLNNQQFYLIDPVDLSVSSYIDITTLNVDIDNIYDIATGLKFPMYINAGSAAYQDFDLFQRGDQLDIFVSGFHQAWHFILRIRVIDQDIQSAKVAIASGSVLSPPDNSPHGVAVNSKGLVLTTLGWTGKVANVDRGAVFGADFPEDKTQTPVFLFDEYQTFSSRGMTCDNNDNYYIATGWCGSGVAGGGASIIIVVPASLAKTYSFSFRSLYANPRDITFNTYNKNLYISDSNTDIFSEEDVIWVMPDVSVGVIKNENYPGQFLLMQNYPNPFNPCTTIGYSIANSAYVTLKIYDILGKEITTLINEDQLPGVYRVDFNGKNISSGIYFYQITAGNFTDTKKLLLLK